MSDLHVLPLREHDLPRRPMVRAHVFSTSPHHWYWEYLTPDLTTSSTLMHGPFASQGDAYASAWHMVEVL